MSFTDSEIRQLKELEETLWRTETRFDRSYMDGILSQDFFEFGRSGRIYGREETLSASPQEINAAIPLKEFKVHAISTDVALVTYVSEILSGTQQVGNRSSIWVKSAAGWKLAFHQGTPVIR